MENNNYETMKEHLKGFWQGLLFILVMVAIIFFFHLIGYVDMRFSFSEYDDYGEVEVWNEEIERSEGIRDSDAKDSPNKKIYEQRKSDFGSKSLNQKDREAAEQAEKEKMKGKL